MGHWLTSETTRAALEKAARAMLGRYDIQLRFGTNTCTDILTYIELNPERYVKLKEPDYIKWILLKADRDHEVGHQFTYVGSKVAVAKKYTSQFRQAVAADIFNILEDGRIELLQSLEFPGCGPVLRFSNEYWFSKMIPHNSRLENFPAYRQFLHGLLQQAIVGKLKGELPDKRAMKALEKCLPIISQAKRCPTSDGVVELTHQVMDIIADLLDEVEDFEGNLEYTFVSKTDPKSGTKRPSTAPPIPPNFPNIGADEAASSGANGENSAEAKPNGEYNADEDAESKDGTDSEAGRKSLPDSAGEGEENSEDREGEQEDGDGQKEREKRQGDKGKRDSGFTIVDAPEAPELSPELQLLIKKTKEELQDLVEAIYATNNDPIENERDRKQLQELIKKLAEQKHSVANHSGVTLIINNPRPTPSEVSEFYKQLPTLQLEAERGKREIQRVLFKAHAAKKPRTRRNRGYLDDRYAYKAVAFNDPHIFRQRGERHLRNDSVVGLLVDESGSMGCEERWLHARKAAIVFSLILRSLKIPHFVTGFTSVGRSVIHNEYISFVDCFHSSSLPRLQTIFPRYDNRDGYSLRVAYEVLATRKEERKLLLVITDGLPYSFSYTGEAAVEDSRQAVEEALRSGIVTVGISIGHERYHMPIIYRYHVIVSQLEGLPRIVAKVLEKVF